MNAEPDRREAGFTLVEMIVASMLFALVFVALGGVMISTVTTQRTITEVSSSTIDADFLASTIDDRIRNSSEFRLVASGGDQMLVARVAGTGATVSWQCYAWHYSASKDQLRMRTSTPGTVVGVPTATQLSTWVLLADDVVPRGSSTTIFSATGPQLAVAFDIAVDGAQPVSIDFTTARLTNVTGAGTC